ncbi:MAG TPA: ATP-binding protein, partial [Tepidisphaeraceae bacterium]|nr:ATP-binding protein [Tepidisphaeraceae bacterium]
PEFLPRAFERFQQDQTTLDRGHGGMGLGLSIVRDLVNLHGGSVHAASPGPEQGSTFTVILPLAEPP